MSGISGISKFFKMYYQGIKSMTLGKTLWIIVFIKLFIMFAILKMFFFPNFLNSVAKTDEDKAQYVFKQLTEDGQNNLPDSDK